MENHCYEACAPLHANVGMILIHSRIRGEIWLTPIGQDFLVQANGADLLRTSETRESRKIHLHSLLKPNV